MTEAERTAPVVVTGATGFIGSQLVATLAARGYAVRAVTRRGNRRSLPPGVERHEIANLVGTEWAGVLRGADAIVHTAAMAHRAEPGTAEERERIRAVNVEATGELAAAANACGVRRMVLLSSIGVLGAQSGDGAFNASTPPAPHDFYSRTKLESERIAMALAAQGSVEVSIVRPPLVFGPHAPGNFGRLMKGLQRGIPLPLGAVHNRRSFVSVWNLCDFVIACLTSGGAIGLPLLVADEEVVSIAELLRRCARILGNRLPPLPVPVALLRLAGAVVGRQADIERLCSSLIVDTRDSQTRTGWRPPLSLSEGLYRTLRPEHVA
ncbi:MAG: NAD-dependent epimerase/dehydratase family protein [Steroidobacteraceae bacterium]